MDTKNKFSERPTWLELERVIPLSEAVELTSISRDGLLRHHHDKIVRLSPRRVGMKLRDAIAIGGTTAID
jgi:hypothetical protein